MTARSAGAESCSALERSEVMGWDRQRRPAPPKARPAAHREGDHPNPLGGFPSAAANVYNLL